MPDFKFVSTKTATTDALDVPLGDINDEIISLFNRIDVNSTVMIAMMDWYLDVSGHVSGETGDPVALALEKRLKVLWPPGKPPEYPPVKIVLCPPESEHYGGSSKEILDDLISDGLVELHFAEVMPNSLMHNKIFIFRNISNADDIPGFGDYLAVSSANLYWSQLYQANEMVVINDLSDVIGWYEDYVQRKHSQYIG
ncbi:MAG: hypothetical protein GKR93_18005 [Gammaproteobacteria bacterium]|nr:hypothetical protein [Gammaproteobacteria bacterium]